MSAYRLTKEWQAVDERSGVLQNTGEQNLEYLILNEEPTLMYANSGKVLNPQNKIFFELQEGYNLYVRAFNVFDGGFIPTASVESIVDFFHREDNPLEGTTNSLTIGVSVWNPKTSYYPEDWVVIAKNLMWKCLVAHDNDSDFDADVARGYWQNIITAINSIEIDGTSIILKNTKDEETEIPITALSAVEDADGNVITETYATKTELSNEVSTLNNTINSVEDSLVRSVTKKDDTTITVAMGNDETSTDIQIGSTTYATKTELSNTEDALVRSVVRKDDTTITVTMGDDTTAVDISLGANTYTTPSDVSAAVNTAVTNGLAPYVFLVRQPSTLYTVGKTVFTESLGISYKLECSTAGVTSASALTVPTGATSVTDGTVVWDTSVIGSGGGDGIPIGSYLLWSSNNVALPEGYLACDGSAVSRTTYSELFAVIGTTYGVGDGSTTFNLPNYSDDKFFEGSGTAGTTKSAGLPNITGSIDVDARFTSKSGAFNGSTYSGYDYYYPSSSSYPSYHKTASFSASDSNSIYGNSTTVQPYSMTCRVLIKYQ